MMNKIRWITRDAKGFGGKPEMISLWSKKPVLFGGEWVPEYSQVDGLIMPSDVCIWQEPTTEILQLLFGRDFLKPGEIEKFSSAIALYDVREKGKEK